MIAVRIVFCAAALAAAGAALADRVSMRTEIPGGTEPTLGVAIVIRDQAPLRSAPRDSAQPHALLWQGEALEVRGERRDYLQVYDHRRERSGFVRASQVRRTMLSAAEARELLAVVRFLRDSAGAEALGIGFAAAYIGAAPPEMLNGDAGVEALDALGTFADRLARSASSSAPRSKAAQAALSAHLDVAQRYGVGFVSHERGGRVQICYDGDAFRRVLAMRATPAQQARAALALTRSECIAPSLSPTERNRMDEWRADVLERVDVRSLPPYLRNRVLMRRAGVWAGLAYQSERKGETSEAAEERALTELAGVDKAELTDEDASAYNDAAMRVGASRWAYSPSPRGATGRQPHIVTAPGQPGETCIALVDAKNDVAHALAKRCTYGIVWTNSTTLNREGTALAVAVQPMESWRELWLFRKSANAWTIRVLPPAAATPEVGYVEFAGWVPGGAKMLVVREARAEGSYLRRFEILRLATLAAERQAPTAGALREFQRWQDPAWRRETLSLR
jgi:hypothetical protein